MSPQETDTVIIGAGPAGLAMGACLQRSARAFRILEQADELGIAWKRHYQRLHLHTVREHSALPLMPIRRDRPRYLSRLQFVDYLESYAREFALRPDYGCRVGPISRTAQGWRLRTNKGDFRARNVVMATGYNRLPNIPEFAGASSASIPIIHSRSYGTGKDYQGQRVLVVGMGNTGAELALDLCEQGADSTISVRGPVHIVPREFLGTPTQVTGIRLGWLPAVVRDWLGVAVSRQVFGDLRRHGLERPREGVVSQVLNRGRVPVLDVGTMARIEKGDIAVRPNIARIEGDVVHFVDERAERFDAIVLATGYRPGLAELIDGYSLLANQRQLPPDIDGEPVLPGLFFLGFKNPPTGMIREIARDAPRIAARLR